MGATGHLGRKILDALVSGGFQVTALKREGSLSVLDHQNIVKVTEIPSNSTLETWVEMLRGHDACVVTFQTRNLDLHLTISEAAAAAGVKRLIPADFGSCDSSSSQAQDLVPLFLKKAKIRDELDKLVQKYPGFTWTSIVTGHFFDWGLVSGFMHFDLKNRKAFFLDDGTRCASASTLSRIGEAVAKILAMPSSENLKNKMVYIQSFCVSSLNILRSLEKATGQKWEVTSQDSEKFIEKHQVEFQKGNTSAIEELVYALGVIDGNWENRENFAMETLGLENENLDDVVAYIIKAT